MTRPTPIAVRLEAGDVTIDRADAARETVGPVT